MNIIEQKKLNNMGIPKLRALLQATEKKKAKCPKVDSHNWVICDINIGQIKRELDFKKLIVAGLKVMMRD